MRESGRSGPARPDGGFTEVDWTTDGSASRWPDPRTAGAALLALGWGALFVHDLLVAPPDAPTTPWWDATTIDWLFVPSLVVFVAVVARSVLASPRLARRRLRALVDEPVAVAAAGFLALVVVYGLVGPLVLGAPELHFRYDHQPPFWASVNAEFVADCYGSVVEGRCQGTMRFPLGTDRQGNDLFVRLAWGTRTAVQAGFVTAMLVVPLASLLGTASAMYGGRTDEVLMRYLDVQQSILPLLVYLLLFGASQQGAPISAGLFTLVVVFSVLDSGGVARTVRARARGLTSEGYVRAARAAGASRWTVTRRHLLPNVLGVAVTGAALLAARVVLAEAAVSFMDLGEPLTTSWGETMHDVVRNGPFVFWWIPFETMVLLGGTVLSLQVFGTALGDVLDPEQD